MNRPLVPAGIVGVGSYVPPKVLTNFDLEKMVETSDEWIRTRSGISERRIAEQEVASSDLAMNAARPALERAGVAPADLDLIVVATVSPDMLLSEVDVSKYAAVIFVGGVGAAEYFDDTAAHEIAREAVKQNKLLCSICIASSTLANAGVLKGKKATCWPSEKGNLEAHGAIYVDDDVVRDGNIITSDGPENARAFARIICHTLAATRE